MDRRSVLVVLCLITTTWLPVAQAQDASSGSPLHLSLNVEAVHPDEETTAFPSFDATFHPDDTLRFTLAVTNAGDQATTLTFDSSHVYHLAIRDVFGGGVHAVEADPAYEGGGSIQLDPGETERVAEVTWDPGEHAKAWMQEHDTVVSYYQATATLHEPDHSVEARQSFQVETPDLEVDAFDREFGGPFQPAYTPGFEGSAVPIRLRNVGDGTVRGTLSFTVRDADGLVHRSADLGAVDLNASDPPASASWDMTDADGAVVGDGTYLLRVVVAGEQTRYVDEFPVRVREALQMPLQPIVRVERQRAEPGETLRIGVGLENPSDQARRLTFPTHQQFDVVVTRPDGTTWRWSDGRAFAQSETSRVVEAGGRVVWTANFTLAPDAPIGPYRARGIVTTEEPMRSLPTSFFVGGAHRQPVCTGGNETDLAISLTDADGQSVAVLPPGDPVRVNLVNRAGAVYDDGAMVTITGDGRQVFEERVEPGVKIYPDQAHTFDWDQEDPEGRQVPNGSYRVRVRTPGGSVGFAFEIGDPAGTSGISTGRIQGTACEFSVPEYLHPIQVRTDRAHYPLGENVTVRYRAQRPIEGDVRFRVLDGDRTVVFTDTIHLDEPLAPGEPGRVKWSQRTADGTPAEPGFYIAQVRAGSRGGETPFLVGDVPAGAPAESVEIEPDTRGPTRPAWDEQSLDGARLAYGRTYAAMLARGPGPADGGFEWDGEVAQGTYVTFSFDPSGRITGYSVAPEARSQATVFSSISARPYEAVPSGSTQGGVALPNPLVAETNFVHRARSAMIHVMDSPNGLLMVRSAEDKTVDFTLAEGYTATVLGTGERCVDVRGNRSVRLCLDGGGSMQVTGSIVRAEMEAGSQLMAVVSPDRPAAQEIVDGITSGAVGAEIAVGANGSSADPFLYGPGFTEITSEPLPSGVRVRLDRRVSDGTCVVLNVPPETLETTRVEEIQVTLDGETLPRASNVGTLLSTCGQTGEGSYLVTVGEQVQVVVSVPHFSERAITIQNLAEVTQSPEFRLALTQAALVSGVITLAAAVAVFRSKE